MSQIKTVAFFVILAVLLIVAIDTLLTTPVSERNSAIIRGHFKAVEKENHRNSISYNLLIQEDDRNYQIIADWSGCFQYSFFQSEVKEGELIQLTLKKNGGIRLSNRPSVVSVVVNNINYMSSDCVNLHIADEKTETPLICLGLIIFVGGYLYVKRDKNELKKPL